MEIWIAGTSDDKKYKNYIEVPKPQGTEDQTTEDAQGGDGDAARKA